MKIDADCHVVETERTWEYLEPSERKYKPVRVVVNREGETSPEEYWLIDGRLERWRIFEDQTETSLESREMASIETRLRHMDELGVDIQVLYPTLFLFPLTKNPEVELALCRSYNRWLADIWSKGKGRLRWAAVVPFLTMDAALEELRFATQYGACAAALRPHNDHRLLHDPYFYPLYEECSRLDIPVGVHAANGSFLLREQFPGTGTAYYTAKLATVGAMYAMVFSGIPDRFPRLRIGVIEAQASWLPDALYYMARQWRRLRGEALPDDLLRSKRVYVSCMSDEDVGYLVQYAGEDNLLIGSDYGHHDQGSELEALSNLKKQGKLPPHVVDKILEDNPRTFYGL